MTTPVPPSWPEAYCEQCGARADLTAAAGEKHGGWRATPLRTCVDCGLLSCRSCWHPRSTRCERCFAERIGKAHGVAPLAQPDDVPQPTTPVIPEAVVVEQPTPPSAAPPPEPVLRTQPAPIAARARLPDRPPRRLAAIAAVLGLAVVGAAAFVRIPDAAQQDAGVAGLTSRPSASSEVSRPAGGAEPSPRPTGSAAPRSSVATPGRLELVDAIVTSWVDDVGEVRAHVVATVENRGGSAARVPGSESSFLIVDADGAAVAGGLFGHAFPPVVQPGERAFLMDTLSATFADPDEIADVVVEVAFEPTADTLRAVDVADLEWTTGAGGLVVSGDVQNAGTDEITSAAVAVVLLDARSRVLGGVYDLTDVAGLAPGVRVRFRTAYPGLPPIEPAEIAEAVVVAFEQP
jgi:hypothetical protein